MRHSLFLSFSFLFSFSFFLFLLDFPPFWARSWRTRTQLSWALVFDSKRTFSCNFCWVADGWWLSGSRIEPRRAQMNGHYVYPKWKRGLKWIFNEPGSWGLAQCVAVSWRVILPAKDMLQLNKKKITLKRCGVSTALASLGGQPFVTF